jgi:hypothetical protein
MPNLAKIKKEQLKNDIWIGIRIHPTNGEVPSGRCSIRSRGAEARAASGAAALKRDEFLAEKNGVWAPVVASAVRELDRRREAPQDAGSDSRRRTRPMGAGGRLDAGSWATHPSRRGARRAGRKASERSE